MEQAHESLIKPHNRPYRAPNDGDGKRSRLQKDAQPVVKTRRRTHNLHLMEEKYFWFSEMTWKMSQVLNLNSTHDNCVY